jgi:histidinol phosphatase-like enzyme (inositol monophosphatase family)
MIAPSPDRLAPDRLAALEEFLLELNRASAAHILPLFRSDHGLRDKGGPGVFDPVTEADVGAEKVIRGLIGERFPEHGVIGEELGEDRPGADFVWVLDPVDGTRAFIAGLPTWCTLIGLRWQGRPVLGSVGQPYIGETYLGHAGGSRLVSRGGEQQLRVRPCPKLAGAVIATTDPEGCFEPPEREAWGRVRAAARLARTGCDAYAFAQVATGGIDLVLEAGLKAWDIEAIIPIIEGAGGAVTDWRGAPLGDQGGQVAAAGDRACLEAALELLQPAAA